MEITRTLLVPLFLALVLVSTWALPNYSYDEFQEYSDYPIGYERETNGLDGMLVNAMNFVPASEGKCSATQFQCDASPNPQCVSLLSKCDGSVDCRNGRDEANCGSPTRNPVGGPSNQHGSKPNNQLGGMSNNQLGGMSNNQLGGMSNNQQGGGRITRKPGGAVLPSCGSGSQQRLSQQAQEPMSSYTQTPRPFHAQQPAPTQRPFYAQQPPRTQRPLYAQQPPRTQRPLYAQQPPPMQQPLFPLQNLLGSFVNVGVAVNVNKKMGADRDNEQNSEYFDEDDRREIGEASWDSMSNANEGENEFYGNTGNREADEWPVNHVSLLDVVDTTFDDTWVDSNSRSNNDGEFYSNNLNGADNYDSDNYQWGSNGAEY